MFFEKSFHDISPFVISGISPLYYVTIISHKQSAEYNCPIRREQVSDLRICEGIKINYNIIYDDIIRVSKNLLWNAEGGVPYKIIYVE